MELNACLEKYIELTGRDDIKETVFFEDTPDVVGVYVPGWDFSIEEKSKGYVGKAACASSFYTGEITIDSKNQLELPAELERSAITACLENEDKRGEFIFCLLAGRLLLVEESFVLEGDTRGDWTLNRDNICISFKKSEEGQYFKITVDEKEYAGFKLEDQLTMEHDYKDFTELLLKFSAPAKTSVSQEELLLRLLEKYPEFEEHIVRRLSPDNHNICIYQMDMPINDSNEKLWLYFDNEGAGVGIYPYVLCDDIGLHIDAVSGYIDSIMNEEVLLLKYYKTKEAFEEGKPEKYEWAAPPKSGEREDLQTKLVKKSSGLGRLFNKLAYIEAFSYNGTYSFTVSF